MTDSRKERHKARAGKLTRDELGQLLDAIWAGGAEDPREISPEDFRLLAKLRKAYEETF